MTFVELAPPADQPTGIIDAQGQRIQLSNTLTNPTWTDLEGAYVENFSYRTNGIGSGMFSRQYGNIKRPETKEIDYKTPEQIVDSFVRMELYSYPDWPVWYGYVTTKLDRRDGDVNANDVILVDTSLMGEEVYYAVGLEYFLDRFQINGHYTTREENDEQNPGSFKYENPLFIPKAVTFNDRRAPNQFDLGLDQLGNMAADRSVTINKGQPDEEIIRIFPRDSRERTVPWSAWEILRYLVYLHLPKVRTFGYPIPIQNWQIGEDTTDELNIQNILKWHFPVIETEGRTMLKIFNDIMNPSRGMVWWLDYNDFTETAIVKVASTSVSTLTIPANAGWEERDIPPNKNQIELNYDDIKEITQAISKQNLNSSYSQIVVRGAQRTVTATYSYQATTLSEGWELDTETAYLRNPTGNLNETDKAKIMAARNGPKYDKVFTRFILEPSFKGGTNDGDIPGVVPLQNAFITLTDDSEVPNWPNPPEAGVTPTVDVLPATYGGFAWVPPYDIQYFNHATLRFSKVLPFKDGYEYDASYEQGGSTSDEWIVSPQRTDSAGDSNEATYQHLFGVFKSGTRPYKKDPDDGIQTDVYTYVHQTGMEVAHTEPKSIPQLANNKFPAHIITPLSDAPGFDIRSTDGHPTYYAKGHIDVNDEGDPGDPGADPPVPPTPPVMPFYDQPVLTDYGWEEIRITAMCEIHDYCQVIITSDAVSKQGDTLVINMGDGYRLDFLARNTITHLTDDQQLVTNPNGGILRDDRSALNGIANAAKQWYASTYRQLSLQFRYIRTFIYDADQFEIDPIAAKQPGLKLGFMITQIGYLGLNPLDINTVITEVTYNGRQQTSTFNTSMFQFPTTGVSRQGRDTSYRRPGQSAAEYTGLPVR